MSDIVFEKGNTIDYHGEDGSITECVIDDINVTGWYEKFRNQMRKAFDVQVFTLKVIGTDKIIQTVEQGKFRLKS